MRVPVSDVESLGVKAFAKPSVTRVVPKLVPAASRLGIEMLGGGAEPPPKIGVETSDARSPLVVAPSCTWVLIRIRPVAVIIAVKSGVGPPAAELAFKRMLPITIVKLPF